MSASCAVEELVRANRNGPPCGTTDTRSAPEEPAVPEGGHFGGPVRSLRRAVWASPAAIRQPARKFTLAFGNSAPPRDRA
jgi:hypothetical protein